MSIELTPLQAAGKDRILTWFFDPHSPQTFYLAGVAGSGKSTLLEHVVAEIDGRVEFCAPTGKAALVMQRKGLPTATTVHKLCYLPAGDPPSPKVIERLRDELRRLSALKDPTAQKNAIHIREQLERAERDAQRKGPRFSLNPDSELQFAKLGVIDECSMCDAVMGHDLESFGTKLLVVGDPAQLPPVMGAGYFTSREPDWFLNEIHRQALDSPILQLATLARQGQRLPFGQIGEGVEVLCYGDPSLEERAMNAGMILVGRNRTRHACNAKIRRLMGRAESPAPVKGDRVMCLRNDHEIGVLNGSTWTVDECVPNYDEMICTLSVLSDDDGRRVTCESWLHHFMAREGELAGGERRQNLEWGYAYAQTVHKSQGSAYDDVLVFDESKQFGKDAHRHLYTAITRAAKTLTVVQ